MLQKNRRKTQHIHAILIILLNYTEGCSSNDNNVRISNKRASETENGKMNKKQQEDSVVLQKNTMSSLREILLLTSLYRCQYENITIR